MPSARVPSINIIGAGRVGKTLAKLWNDAGVLRIQDVQCRSAASAIAAVDFIGAGTPIDNGGALRSADIHLLSVPDDMISQTVDLLAGHISLEGSIVFHVSGLRTSELLQAARQKGAATASVHPIKSFADPALAAPTFTGTPCGVEGETSALDVLNPLFTAIGGTPVIIDSAHKSLYHAAAVLSSNYIVTLTALAEKCLIASGVPKSKAKNMLMPLLHSTVQNIEELGTVHALTGPIVRGDTSTVKTHVDALQRWDASMAKTYLDLASQTLDIAAQQGTLPEQLAAIQDVLDT
jgi:predicted short-subunit dehydrogenase-like oxidoreductase (DUF2520 family)